MHQIYGWNYCVFGFCPKSKNPVIPSVLHHRQNPLGSTSNVYGTFCNLHDFIAQTTIAPHKYIFACCVGTRVLWNLCHVEFGPSHSVSARSSGWPFQQSENITGLHVN
jgi:hypothetical protein